MPVEKAIYCATYTPARRMHLDDRGMIGPGKLADFVFLKDLDTMEPEAVVKEGRLAWIEGDSRCGMEEETNFPEHFYHSVHCRPATVKSILYEIFLCKRKHSRKKQPAGAVKIHQLPETRASEFFLPYKFKLGL